MDDANESPAPPQAPQQPIPQQPPPPPPPSEEASAPPGEFVESAAASSAYDLAFIQSHNALENSFYMRGREMSIHHWRLRSELEDAYERKGALPDYEKVSLYNVYK